MITHQLAFAIKFVRVLLSLRSPGFGRSVSTLPG